MKTNLGPPRYYRCVCVKHPLGFIGGPTWYEETDDPNAETRIVIAEKTMTAEELARIVRDYRMAERDNERLDTVSSFADMVNARTKLDRCVAAVLERTEEE